MPNTTLYDLAVLHRADPFTGLIEDVTTLAPEFGSFGAVKRDGTWYEVASRTTLPTAQFRYVNQGVATSKSTYKKQLKEMFNLEVQLQMDEAIWKADPGNIGSLWQLEAAGAMKAAGILIGQQVWYGTNADSKGFTGVRNQLAYTVALQTGGNNTNTTSAYLTWMDDREGCRFDVGEGGQFAISSPRIQTVYDSTLNPFNAFVGNLQAWLGFNIGSSYSAWSLSAIEPSTFAHWCNDSSASQLIAKIPVARRSNLCWFMNRTCESTLQRGRSTVNIGIPSGSVLASYQAAGADGRPAFSPKPNQMCGYPIILTDSVLDSETN